MSSALIVAQELDGLGGELVWVLEQEAVIGVGVDDDAGVGDVPRQAVGLRGGKHPIVVAVGDEGWRGRGLVGRLLMTFSISFPRPGLQVRPRKLQLL